MPDSTFETTHAAPVKKGPDLDTKTKAPKSNLRAPKTLQAKVVHYTQDNQGYVTIHLSVGAAHGVKPKMEGKFLSETKQDFTITSCDASNCQATFKQTIDFVKGNKLVVIDLTERK